MDYVIVLVWETSQNNVFNHEILFVSHWIFHLTPMIYSDMDYVIVGAGPVFSYKLRYNVSCYENTAPGQQHKTMFSITKYSLFTTESFT